MKQTKNSIEGLRKLKIELRKALLSLPDNAVSQQVINDINKTIGLLGEIQARNHLTRLLIWQCTYYVIDFLRRNKQMDRAKFGFDAEIVEALDDIMTDLTIEFRFKHKALKN